jgi:thiol:disulfide interchange protein
MKRLRYVFNRTLLFILLAASFAVQAEEPTGIRFFKGSWKAVLNEAQKQNKPVFIDIYTTWCGPCKQMARQAFPDAKVGEKFNANFISYQLDAERGEGVQIARKYTVTAYPTTLFVSPDGALIHRVVGYGGIQAMLTEADKAIAAAADPNPLSALEKHYASN